MKKSIIVTVCLIIVGSLVYAQRPSLPAHESRYFTSPAMEKSFRQRLTDIEHRLDSLTERIKQFEEKLNPTPELKKSGEAKRIQLSLEVGQIVYFDTNQNFKIEQIIDKQNMIVEARIDFRNRYGESVNAAYTRGGPYEAISRPIWISGFNTSTYADNIIVTPNSNQFFKITGTKSYDTLFAGIKTLFVLEPYNH